ncbi:bifunctional hydroxymethylpyrimidine kinase/phosphomethylpyrimidine kinase [Adlercreutzia shanghongiae]|uniref:Bifunctional hydroxymethylpyrimidine kinase/phosphomethylpyrimidine kinase n=1 Tax=Adlercreutzia shanghongiae TaxID=3111773 RepID=A0ABU6J197_9ACTN|nr:bifunctional hydroxymethylpyrimidine kinase/phosphomethylpyrimidine kinase [Adlercreutzia sp. R22]MEC4295810.1 bifunctional hydroxymethylpyrimidine kinase/phosphomethylpyrimidine kinase [Adlercreutzia sp. R22]
MKAVLTIAGSDSSGGAGIQADLKTITAHQLFGESVITALTAQNTMGVTGVLDVDPAFVGQQIDAVFEDIRPDAVKVGMVSSPEIVAAIAEGLVRHRAENIVVDPVMVATSGSALIADAAVNALVERLFPLASVITPNIPEAEVLAGMGITAPDDVARAADLIAERCKAAGEGGAGSGDFGIPAIMIKGGHGVGDPDAADDYLRLAHGERVWLRGPRIANENTHGTGCSLSSAIACRLAQGFAVDVAVREAKAYVAGALAAGLNLGRGSGPLNHMWQYGPVSC